MRLLRVKRRVLSEFFCKAWKTSSKGNSPPGPTYLLRGISCSSPDTLSGFHFTSLPLTLLPSTPGCLEAGLQLGWTFHTPLDPSKLLHTWKVSQASLQFPYRAEPPCGPCLSEFQGPHVNESTWKSQSVVSNYHL